MAPKTKHGMTASSFKAMREEIADIEALQEVTLPTVTCKNGYHAQKFTRAEFLAYEKIGDMPDLFECPTEHEEPTGPPAPPESQESKILKELSDGVVREITDQLIEGHTCEDSTRCDVCNPPRHIGKIGIGKHELAELLGFPDGIVMHVEHGQNGTSIVFTIEHPDLPSVPRRYANSYVLPVMPWEP